MGIILYLTSNAIRIYAICIFIDTFLGKSRLNSKLKTLTYFAYFFREFLLADYKKFNLEHYC